MGEVMLCDYQTCIYHPKNSVITEEKCDLRPFGHCPEECPLYCPVEKYNIVTKKTVVPDRATILDKAKKCVCGDREQDYGSPAENFRTIANLWIDYLQGTGQPVDITPRDVAVMMSLVKIARITSGKAKEDNWIDACGYLALGAEIEAQEREKEI